MVRNVPSGLSLQGRWFFSSVFLANGVQWDKWAFTYKHFLTNYYQWCELPPRTQGVLQTQAICPIAHH